MEAQYPIMFAEERIGWARVQKRGLYYKIRCSCQLSGEVPFKVKAVGALNQLDLGVCAPAGREYTLESFFPVSKLGEGKLKFEAIPRKTDTVERYIPIRADEPFAYLARLENAYLQHRMGEVGIILR